MSERENDARGSQYAIAEHVLRRADEAKRTFWGYLGGEVVHADQGKAEIRLDVQPHHLNMLDMVHGGVLASLLDNAMGIAVMSVLPDAASVTTNLNLHYVAAARGERLTVTAEVVHRSRSTLTLTGAVTDEGGGVCTIGTASYRIL